MTTETGGLSEMGCRNKYYIGFDLGGSSLKYGYGNKEKGLLFSDKIYHQTYSSNGVPAVESIESRGADLPSLITTFRTAFTHLSKQHKHFKALGLASPGVIDTANGIVLGSTPNLPYIKNVNLKDILHDITHLPIFIENDANLMTFAEAMHWESDSTLGITLGSGIGTGFVHQNSIFSGTKYLAMEAGHTIVMPNGRTCLCGKKGCLEAYSSADSIVRIISEIFPYKNKLNIEEIIRSDNPAIKKVLNEILELLAISLSNLVMVLNPDTVVIGGGVIEIDGFDFEYLKSNILNHLTSEFRDINIQKAYYKNTSGVMGAILYSENNFNLL